MAATGLTVQWLLAMYYMAVASSDWGPEGHHLCRVGQSLTYEARAMQGRYVVWSMLAELSWLNPVDVSNIQE